MSHIFLTGFMGAGKSSVGRLVAARLGRPFVDLDSEIEKREGASVPAIFKSRGEEGFRNAEHAALEALAAAEPSVVATGGGVVLREDNQALLGRIGTVVYLSVTPEEAIARLGDAGDRPLLAGGGLSAARTILGARLALYEKTADHVVDTVGRSESAVAEDVVDAISLSPAEVIGVRSAGETYSYDIVIGKGILDEVGHRVRAAAASGRVAVVSDANVWGILGDRVSASLEAAGLHVSVNVVEPGEASKSWTQAGRLLEEFAAAGLDRGSTVVALGGGVVGDLAGFCASAYMRGIALVHVPTTLLAQVDSAIGGKTGVDLDAGKNLAGAFWPPALVLSDTSVLATLPAAEWTNGMAEVVKTALLAGGDVLERLEHGLDGVMSREPAAVLATVRDAASFKANVVTTDLRESGMRECLNLGHTLGHALELLAGYGTIPHGLAVAEGMRFAAVLAERLGPVEAGLRARTTRLLEAVGAGEAACGEPLAGMFGRVSAAEVLAAMKGDKKSRDGHVRFVLISAPGAWRAVAVDDEMLLAVLGEWVAARVSKGE